MKSKFVITIFLVFFSIGIVGCGSSSNKEVLAPEKVVENHFKYMNEKNKDGILSTLTEVHKNTIFGFENLEGKKILDIKEDTSEDVRKAYLFKGRGSDNGTTEENLKVYKVKYEVKYKNDGIGPQDSGTYDWWFFLIRKDKNSPWLIDDFGY